jgi:hypothetical protein
MLRGIGGPARRGRGKRVPGWARTDAVALLVVLLVLGGGAVAGMAAAGVIESEPAPNPGSYPTPPGPAASLHPQLVAQRVERLRALDFRRVPSVRVLGQARFKQATEAIGKRGRQEKSGSASSRHARRTGRAAQYLLKLAAVVPPDFRFANAQQELGLEVAGVYDPKRKTVLFPRKIAAGGGEQAQGYLAHELTHALDDQHFGIELPGHPNPYAESVGAFEALVEGDASYIQLLYARRFGSSTLSARQQIKREAAGATAPLTPPLTQAALFPYIDGASFVGALRRRGGWGTVDRAWRGDAPRTSQQILHPRAYFAGTRPLSVPVPPANALGGGWTLVGDGTIGEEDTRVVLTVGLREAVSARIADGWRGARFAVWRRKGAPRCAGACRTDTAAVMVWRWRSSRSAALFAGGLHDYATLGFLAKPAGPLTWRVDGGYMAALPTGSSSAIAFAPGEGQARDLAQRAAVAAAP